MTVGVKFISEVLFSVQCFLMLLSLLIFYLFRKEHQIQIRSPWLSIYIGIICFALVVLIQRNAIEPFACSLVLWTGNLLMNLQLSLGLLRDWSIAVISDRNLRKKYRWTLKRFPTLTIAVLFSFFTIFSTLMIQYLSKEYNKIALEETCFFLMPWWEFLPQIIPIFVGRICLVMRSKDKFVDNYGIFIELRAYQIVAIIVFVLYIICTKNFVNSLGIPFSSSYILVVVPITNCFVTITVPCIKVLLEKKAICSKKVFGKDSRQRRKFSNRCVITVKRSIVGTFRSPSMHSQSQKFFEEKESQISRILKEPKQAEAFREHAKRYFCTESVDFCAEVLWYKHSTETEFLTSSVKTQIDEYFLSILTEFIIPGAPSEVNISHSQKQHLLQYKTFDQFSTLSQFEMRAIYKEAEQEVEKVLKPILCSFQATNKRS